MSNINNWIQCKPEMGSLERFINIHCACMFALNINSTDRHSCSPNDGKIDCEVVKSTSTASFLGCEKTAPTSIEWGSYGKFHQCLENLSASIDDSDS